MNSARFLSILFACIHLTSIAKAADSTNKQPLTINHVQGQVYTINGRLGNVTILYDSTDILMVDTKTEDAAADMQKLVSEQLKGKRIKYIINTHMHFDHSGGDSSLGHDAVIVGQTKARSYLEKHNKHPAWPNVLVDSTLSISLNGEEVKIIHYPLSHTNHDLVVYFSKSHVLAMGDMYFSGMFPFIDEDGTLAGLIKNIGSIIAMLPADVKIVPGHGPVSSLDDLKATRQMLIETSVYMQQQIKAGKSLDAIKKEGFPAKWASWGNGFCKPDCWIETLYEQLQKEKQQHLIY